MIDYSFRSAFQSRWQRSSSKANVIGAKNSNRITMMKFRGCTTALADNNYIP